MIDHIEAVVFGARIEGWHHQGGLPQIVLQRGVNIHLVAACSMANLDLLRTQTELLNERGNQSVLGAARAHHNKSFAF